ncbi:LysR substrate-binding domain-containing protein [Pseudoxanthomonas suwonensis]|uniref:LysR substrate-binding domain-containing protein n=1 Tax=Pseudoxanthomonas suwonensis TaxID=314722 RepID=UPI00138F77CD|nr:LysR substrate-binding domain-containing protein [Pseudoxanthomonas suwonensis]KAF1705555.1 LysR family transcriptional regulator [Pseudoxanthomonas suwonensis]
MDRFDAMQAFVRVVESGSFTRAAQDLDLGRATVTQLVQQLESRLRVRLLDRTTRRVTVTVDGAAFYERALRLLADLDDAETSLPGAATTPRGRLRVDVPSPLARLVVVPALPGFQERYPDIELVLGASDRVVDLMGANVDCVVRGGELADASLVARRLARLALGVYAAPSYLQRHGTPLHPRELEGDVHRIVGFLWASTGKPLDYAMRRGGESVQVHGRQRLAVDDGNAYLAAALAGLGVAWLPCYMADAHVGRGELVPLFAGWTMAPMPLSLAWRPRPYVSARLRAFIDWMVELMAPYDAG